MKPYLLLIFDEKSPMALEADSFKEADAMVTFGCKYKIFDMRTGCMISQSDNFN